MRLFDPSPRARTIPLPTSPTLSVTTYPYEVHCIDRVYLHAYMPKLHLFADSSAMIVSIWRSKRLSKLKTLSAVTDDAVAVLDDLVALYEAQQLLNKLECTACAHFAFVVIGRIIEDRELLRPIVFYGFELLFEDFDGAADERIRAA